MPWWAATVKPQRSQSNHISHMGIEAVPQWSVFPLICFSCLQWHWLIIRSQVEVESVMWSATCNIHSQTILDTDRVWSSPTLIAVPFYLFRLLRIALFNFLITNIDTFWFTEREVVNDESKFNVNLNNEILGITKYRNSN